MTAVPRSPAWEYFSSVLEATRDSEVLSLSYCHFNIASPSIETQPKKIEAKLAAINLLTSIASPFPLTSRQRAFHPQQRANLPESRPDPTLTAPSPSTTSSVSHTRIPDISNPFSSILHHEPLNPFILFLSLLLIDFASTQSLLPTQDAQWTNRRSIAPSLSPPPPS